MKQWANFLPDIMLSVPGCADIVACHELKRAAQEFFRLSRAWRVSIDPIALDVGEASYPLEPDSNQLSVVRIEFAAIGDNELPQESIVSVARKHGARWREQTGTPDSIIQMQAGIIVVSPTPATVLDLNLIVSVAPSDSATGVDDDMASFHMDALITGAKSRLLSIPGQPWTNADLATAMRVMFLDKIVSARSLADRSYGRGRFRSRPGWC